jgi:phosphoglycolate phosphatase
VLKTLEKQNLKWGIVTNKPRRFTQPLVASLGLHLRAACVVSGDDAAKPKPSPETLFLACKEARVKPQHCIYIGDAARDIEAGRAAGMKTAVALFGYIDKTDKPQDWGADAMINTPQELLKIIK